MGCILLYTQIDNLKCKCICIYSYSAFIYIVLFCSYKLSNVGISRILK